MTSKWKKVGLCLAFSLVALGCSSSPKIEPGWTHLELGAGNYGNDGHTQTALRKTVLKEVRYTTQKTNFINQLPRTQNPALLTKSQFKLLDETVEKLIQKRGSRGLFHVNDLVPEYAEKAATHLRSYLKEKGYKEIRVETLPGDYRLIDPSVTLSAHSKQSYDSVHLKNPEASFFHEGIDGHEFISTPQSRSKARKTLQRLANLSDDGLYFFCLSPKEYFPKQEKADYLERGVFYQRTNQWEPVEYIFPDGHVLPKNLGMVLFIPSQKGEPDESS